MFVGGSATFGGSGPGYLTLLDGIADVAGAQSSTITAANILSDGTIGGGGTFIVRSFCSIAELKVVGPEVDALRVQIAAQDAAGWFRSPGRIASGESKAGEFT